MAFFYKKSAKSLLCKFLSLFILGFFFSSHLFSQTVTITAPVAPTTYSAGQTINLTYSLNPSPFTAGNVFTPQLSDGTGSFTAPVNLATRTASTGATGTNHQIVIPFTTPSGSGYRIRVLSSTPTTTSNSNGANLTIVGLVINVPTIVTPASTFIFCQGEALTIGFTQTANFSNTGFNNVYTVQLSDAAGSFTSPTTIGTRTATTAGNIPCVIPAGIPAGSGYRFRIVSSNPVVTSSDNGTNIQINASAGNPSVAGNGFWNSYCFNAANNYTLNYQGYFTENNLSFNTTTRYPNNSYPASANAASGNAYAGCTFTNTNNYSVAYKRTNMPCGYYDFSIVGHDDEGRILIDGVQVYYNTYIGGGPVPNAYRGFISPTNTVEVRYSNTGGGPGFMAINITTVNVINAFAPATICAGTTATLSATNSSTVPLTFDWTPAAFASPTTGTTTIVTPTVTTIFTVSATDAVSGCAATNTVQITVNPVATTTVASTATTALCSGITTATLTAGGAASYTWSPADGLSSTTGFSVIANPTVTTTYTVSGSNNCNTVDAYTTVTMQVIPSAPTPTVFGNGTWNVYCYDGRAFNNYYGYYTENNLSFITSSRWGTGSTPSAATGGTMGLAYQGCNIPVDQHSTSHKRTNFTCGYYQLDVSYHDDDVTIFVDGVQVFQHIGCCDVHTNAWTGFLGAGSTVEVRHQEGGGGSGVGVNFTTIPYPILGPPVTICAGGPGTLTATPFIAGATYSWTPNVGLSSTTGSTIIISPTVDVTYTCTVIDPVSTCSASASQSITVNPLPTTTVSPTTGTLLCSIQSVTLNAGGAYSYSWTPSAGLNTTTGTSVIATPSVTTIYTVTGNNVCADVIATTTITVVPLVSPTVFPSSAWNVYCHNNTTFSNYYGYYTHTGTGTSGYDFNTTTQWVSGAAPSTATANVSGTAYQGCVMGASNISLSFKRTGFVCGTYTIVLNNNDDGVALLIDGVQVGNRAANSGTSVNFWTGILNVNSQVEFKLNQGTGGSNLRVTFTAAAATPSLSTWIGATSSDWNTSSNWCGSGIPDLTTNVLIPNSKPQFMPVISSAGAACKSLTISAASAATSVMSALPAASLTMTGASGLDVYGDWINNGVFTTAGGAVNIVGSNSSSVTGTSINTFNDLVINKTGATTVTIPSGTVQIANSLTLTNGIINQNGSLRFLNNSTVSGASDNSFVNGQVTKIGTQAFTFPVGTKNRYRPIGISAPGVATDNFTAQYFNTDPSTTYTHTSKVSSIDHISRCEYWILNRTGGSSNVNVTLTWNTNSCGVEDLNDLVVSRWDVGPSQWQNHGNGGTTGNTTAGSVTTSAPVIAFSPFTLASISAKNPLPIELVNFSCSVSSRNINSLSWITASETNNDYFSIERSRDGVTFEEVGRLKGAGNNITTLNYNFNDQNSLKGIAYYRLKQVDIGGKYTYSEICSVTNNGDGGVAFYPNPVRNRLTIDYNFNEKPKSDIISVTDVTGKYVEISSSFENSKVTLDCSNLAEGIYFLKVLIGDKEVVNKFTVQK